MALEAGYQYQVLDDITFTRNPTMYRRPRGEKPIARSRNLTATICQHWAIQDSDREIYIEWINLSKATLDLLIAKYVTNNSYSFTDVYGDSYTVVISNLDWHRRLMLDSMGFKVVMTLFCV